MWLFPFNPWTPLCCHYSHSWFFVDLMARSSINPLALIPFYQNIRSFHYCEDIYKACSPSSGITCSMSIVDVTDQFHHVAITFNIFLPLDLVLLLTFSRMSPLHPVSEKSSSATSSSGWGVILTSSVLVKPLHQSVVARPWSLHSSCNSLEMFFHEISFPVPFQPLSGALSSCCSYVLLFYCFLRWITLFSNIIVLIFSWESRWSWHSDLFGVIPFLH